MPVSGRIIEEQKSFFIVNTECGNVRCTIRGALKNAKTKLCAGDLVELDLTNKTPAEGVITTLHSRISLLKRPSVANLSQVFIVTTTKAPPLDLESLDRFLFSAQVYNLEPVIVFNKIDLLENQDLNHLKEIEDIYSRIGYQIIETSASTGLGVNNILQLCADKISAFAGLSGVGKSSLLSLLFPDKTFRIGDVSGTNGRGTHTTTNVSLFPLIQGGFVADTPGLSFVDIPSVPETEVIHYFPELASRIGECRFNDCIHDGEPGCAIQSLLEQNQIAPSRHRNYLKFYKQMKEQRRQYW